MKKVVRIVIVLAVVAAVGLGLRSTAEKGVEVTDAQTRLMRARENRIAELYQHSLARVELGTALGAVERFLP